MINDSGFRPIRAGKAAKRQAAAHRSCGSSRSSSTPDAQSANRWTRSTACKISLRRSREVKASVLEGSIGAELVSLQVVALLTH